MKSSCHSIALILLLFATGVVAEETLRPYPVTDGQVAIMSSIAARRSTFGESTCPKRL